MLPDDTINFVNLFAEEYDLFESDDLASVFRDLLVNKITDKVQEELSDDLSDIVSSVLSNVDSDDISHYMNETSNYLEDAVWDEVADSALVKVGENITYINRQIELDADAFNIGDMRYYLDISDAIKSALSETDYDPDDYYDRGSGQSEDSLVISMFER